jgi:hypothetical protein
MRFDNIVEQVQATFVACTDIEEAALPFDSAAFAAFQKLARANGNKLPVASDYNTGICVGIGLMYRLMDSILVQYQGTMVPVTHNSGAREFTTNP